MMNKGKRIAKQTACVLLVCVLTLLGGCQLARKEEAAAGKDQFVGISVHLLNDFAFNSYGGEEYTDRSIPHDADGMKLYLEIGQIETGEPFMGVNADEYFSDLQTHFKTVDTEAGQSEDVQIKATLYICRDELSGTPYLSLEHLYRKEDGTLYAVDCGSNYGGNLDELSITLKENHAFSDTAGNSTQSTTEVTLSVKERLKVEKVRLYAMRGSQSVGEFILGGEEEIWLVPDTEWVLMEETLSDGSILRTAFNQPLDGTPITLFTVCEGGVFIPQLITLRMAETP